MRKNDQFSFLTVLKVSSSPDQKEADSKGKVKREGYEEKDRMDGYPKKANVWPLGSELLEEPTAQAELGRRRLPKGVSQERGHEGGGLELSIVPP